MSDFQQIEKINLLFLWKNFRKKVTIRDIQCENVIRRAE